MSHFFELDMGMMQVQQEPYITDILSLEIHKHKNQNHQKHEQCYRYLKQQLGYCW